MWYVDSFLHDRLNSPVPTRKLLNRGCHVRSLISPTMRQPTVIYSPKQELHPRFGSAESRTQTAYVRDDLPNSVQAFVIQHELHHLRDQSKWWVWREVKANAFGAIKHPWGFIACLILSMTPSRLKYYANRFRQRR